MKKTLYVFVWACSALLALPAAAQVPGYVPTDGLVGWWPFNGNANDESGNGNDGVVNGATLTEDRNSNENSAFTFDGVDDRISLGNTMQNLGASYNPVSISLWFKTGVGYINGLNNSNGTFISDYKRDGVCCENAYLASIKINSTPTRISYSCGEFSNTYISESNSENYLNDTWFHVTIVKDGIGTQKLYVNGILEDQDSYNPNFDYSQQNPPFEPDWQFGAERWNNGSYASDYIHFYKGQLDDIAIYNRALTPTEITQLYTAAEEPVATCAPLAPNLQNGLVGYWPFCGNANDESGNGNDGTVNGATLTEDRFGNAESAYELTEYSNNIIFTNNPQFDFSEANDLTLSYWLKRTSGNIYSLYKYDNGYPDNSDFAISAGPETSLNLVGNGTNSIPFEVNGDEWEQVTAIFS